MKPRYNWVPTELTESDFNEFIFPHITNGRRGPKPKISYFMIFNAGMVPNINENKRNRKSKKRGRKRLFDQIIFKERFRTIERVFSWEDKFKRLLLRFEYHSIYHYAMKLMAYTMINLRHFCKPPP